MADHAASEAGGSDGAGSSSGEPRSVENLVNAVYGIYNGSCPITAQRHATAARRLQELRDRFLAGSKPTQRQQVVLLCCGIAIQRRAAVIDLSDDMTNAESELRSSLVMAMTLVFVLICIVTMPASSALEAEALLNRVRERSLWDVLQDDGDVADGEVAQALLSLAIANLSTADETSMARDGERFFRHSASEMASLKFKEFGEDNFLSLSASRFCTPASVDSSDPGLLNIVNAAESEAGQSVLRDLMLSFTLPADVVGTRRALLLSRASSSSATLLHSELVQQAHEAAMAGAVYLWENADDDLRRICVLLTGLACIMTRGGEDPIRKGAAFSGRVQLPFLETPMPLRSVLRISLVSNSGLWVLYRLSNEGTPEILSSATGLEGLQYAALGATSER